MSFYGWENCPEISRGQIAQLLNKFQELLASNLIGVYLHGSLAMGCFNPAISDIDLLAITHQTIPVETKWKLIGLLLTVSSNPHPIEISFLSHADLDPWRHPATFDLHFSEGWRTYFVEAQTHNPQPSSILQPDTDTDLAAHITITNRRGICLVGAPIDQVFPEVPEKDYRDSILEDLKWAFERLGKEVKLEYSILNSCRIYAFLCERIICSKAEGATWGLQAFPHEYHPLIQKAMDLYREGKISSQLSRELDQILKLIDYVLAGADSIQSRKDGIP